MDIGLFYRSRIYKEFPVTKFDLLTPYGDYPFEKHHSISGKTDSHDIKPLRFGNKIMQFKAEIDAAVAIGRFHTVPFDQKRGADITEKEIGRKGNKANPDQESSGQGWEKELTDLLMHVSIIKLRHLI